MTAREHALKIFNEHGGILRTRDALAAGIHPRTLYAMRDSGDLEQTARGLFRLTKFPLPGEPDLLTVAKRVPKGVLCLFSALAFHQLTTQVPHRIQIALPRNARAPKLAYPPIQIFRFSEASFTAGVETHFLDGVPVRIFSPEKTLADAFKYRNKIGLDAAIEALRAYRNRKKPQFKKILDYARICRIEKIIRPYLESCL